MTSPIELIEKSKTVEGYESLSDQEKAVVAAYWAGLDQGYRNCSNNVREAVDAVPRHRYHNVQAPLRNAAYTASRRANNSEEILNWEFDF